MVLKKLSKDDLLNELKDMGFDFYEDSLKDINWSSVYEMAINEGFEYSKKDDCWYNKNQSKFTYD